MREIVIAFNPQELMNYLKNNPKSCGYINLSSQNIDLETISQLKGLRKIKSLRSDKAVVEKYLKEYIALMGKLSAKYHSLGWWIYSTASKDYHGSQLFNNLFVFYSLIQQIENNPGDSIVIFDPPRQIISSLRKYCKNRNLDFRLLQNHIMQLFAAIKRKLRMFRLMQIFMFDEWRKIFIAKLYLSNKYRNKNYLKSDAYYVLRTWLLLKNARLRPYVDEYFGMLPEHLLKANKKLMIIAGIIGNYKDVVREIAANEAYDIYPQEFFLKYRDPLMAVIKSIHNRIRITEKTYFMGLDVTDLINNTLDEEQENIYTLRNYIYNYYVKRLLQRHLIERYILTHENYPWEKISIDTLRRHSPQTQIIGYQHSALYPALTNVYLSDTEKETMPLPDRIVTLGKITKDFLINRGNYDANMLQAGCALRFNIHNTTEKVVQPKVKNILVVLGCFPRAKLMIDFVVNAIGGVENYTIRLRPHPASPIAKYRYYLQHDIADYANVSVSSNEAIAADLKWADVVVYDVSAVGLEALSCGKPVIHLKFEDLLDFDSLINCEYLKWEAGTPEELRMALESIAMLSNEEYFEQVNKAKTYVSEYLHDVSEERLNVFCEN